MERHETVLVLSVSAVKLQQLQTTTVTNYNNYKLQQLQTTTVTNLPLTGGCDLIY